MVHVLLGAIKLFLTVTIVHSIINLKGLVLKKDRHHCADPSRVARRTISDGYVNVLYGHHKHTDTSRKRYPIHAEQCCVMHCHNKAILRECDIHLVRLSSDGSAKWGMPCEMCTKILNKYKVRRVIVYYEKETKQMQEYESATSDSDSDEGEDSQSLEAHRLRQKNRWIAAIAKLRRCYGKKWWKYVDNIESIRPP